MSVGGAVCRRRRRRRRSREIISVEDTCARAPLLREQVAKWRTDSAAIGRGRGEDKDRKEGRKEGRETQMTAALINREPPSLSLAWPRTNGRTDGRPKGNFSFQKLGSKRMGRPHPTKVLFVPT